MIVIFLFESFRICRAVVTPEIPLPIITICSIFLDKLGIESQSKLQTLQLNRFLIVAGILYSGIIVIRAICKILIETM